MSNQMFKHPFQFTHKYYIWPYSTFYILKIRFLRLKYLPVTKRFAAPREYECGGVILVIIRHRRLKFLRSKCSPKGLISYCYTIVNNNRSRPTV